jgi:hypothetical protein
MILSIAAFVSKIVFAAAVSFAALDAALADPAAYHQQQRYHHYHLVISLTAASALDAAHPLLTILVLGCNRFCKDRSRRNAFPFLDLSAIRNDVFL